MGFARQEYWSGLPFPSPGDLPDPGIKPMSLALQVDSLPPVLLGSPLLFYFLISFTNLFNHLLVIYSFPNYLLLEWFHWRKNCSYQWQGMRMVDFYPDQMVLVVKNLAANAGNAGSIPGSARSSRRGHGNPLQYSRLKNAMDRGAWWATVHSVAESRTLLKQLSTQYFHFEFL